MKKIIYKLIFLFILSVLITPLVLAKNPNAVENVGQVEPQVKKEMVQEKKLEIQKAKEQRREQLCKRIEDRIAAKIARFEENKSSHVEKYNALKTKLEEITASLKDKGFDTANLESHLAVLDTMVVEYAESYVAFIAQLENSQDNACGESEGAFKDHMKEVRGMFKTLMEQRLAIRKYYVEVIRQDIKEIRDQAREQAAEQVEENVEEISESMEE